MKRKLREGRPAPVPGSKIISVFPRESVVPTSPDGRQLLLNRFDRRVTSELLDVATGERRPVSNRNEVGFAINFSADGRWITVASTDRENRGWFVVPVAAEEESMFRLTSGYATAPAWVPERNEFYYSTRDELRVATYDTDGRSFAVTGDRKVFDISGSVIYGGDFDAANNRFLVARSDPSQPDSLIVVRNWVSELAAGYDRDR